MTKSITIYGIKNCDANRSLAVSQARRQASSMASNFGIGQGVRVTGRRR